MIYLTTKSGKTSKINVFAVGLFLIGIIQIWKPFIPADWQPYELPVVATVTFVLRTFFPNSGEIKTTL